MCEAENELRGYRLLIKKTLFNKKFLEAWKAVLAAERVVIDAERIKAFGGVEK